LRNLIEPQPLDVSVVIDGDKLLRDLRLPYFTIAMLRGMKLGASYELFDVYGPSLGCSEPASAGACIEKIKGGYMLSALWMLNVGKAKRRGHLWSPSVVLKLLPNRKFAVSDVFVSARRPISLDGLKLFVRIVRLGHRLADMATAAGDKEAARKLRPTLSRRIDDRCGHVVKFLDSLAA
jgi:hypothetical protein